MLPELPAKWKNHFQRCFLWRPDIFLTRKKTNRVFFPSIFPISFATLWLSDGKGCLRVFLLSKISQCPTTEVAYNVHCISVLQQRADQAFKEAVLSLTWVSDTSAFRCRSSPIWHHLSYNVTGLNLPSCESRRESKFSYLETVSLQTACAEPNFLWFSNIEQVQLYLNSFITRPKSLNQFLTHLIWLYFRSTSGQELPTLPGLLIRV